MWKARPWVARSIRFAVVVVPALAGVLVAWAVSSALPDPSGVAGWIAWLAVLIGATVLAVVVVQRLARRLLPLSWLLTLTLFFPDRVPSRLRTARRAASRRSTMQAAAEARQRGLGDQPATAAESALVLVAALGAHDRRTQGHSERVRVLADVLAEEAGVSAEDRSRLRWAALLHDIGKLAVPGEILNKPDRPDETEWATLRRHPEEGAKLIEPLADWLGPWADSVAHHHERWDGSGYPEGLSGEDISQGARILAIVDAYEVMTAARPYKKPLSAVAAREELVASSGTHFDPGLVRSFLGVSMGKLWWIVGASAALAQLPLLGRLWSSPAGAQGRRAGAGPAVAGAALTALALAGVVSPATDSTPAVHLATPPAASGPVTPAPAEAAPGDATGTAASPPLAAASAAAPSSVEPRPAAPARPSLPSPSIGGPVSVPPPGTGGGPAPAETPAPVAVSPPPARDPAVLFSGSGRILAPALLAPLGVGVTETEFRLLCAVPPLAQGLDAIVFDLPKEARVDGATVTLTGPAAADFDLSFYSPTCADLGRRSGPTARLPSGARFVVVRSRSGVAADVQLIVASAA